MIVSITRTTKIRESLRETELDVCSSILHDPPEQQGMDGGLKQAKNVVCGMFISCNACVRMHLFYIPMDDM